MRKSSSVSERWLPVVDWPDYEVSDQGRMRRAAGGQGARKGKILSRHISNKGYDLVRLYSGARQATFLVHRLEMLAFVGPDPDRPCVNHKNSVRADNRLENLEWCTYSENAYLTFAAGRGHAILNPYQVIAIQGTRGLIGPQEWSRRLGVKVATIKKARQRKPNPMFAA